VLGRLADHAAGDLLLKVVLLPKQQLGEREGVVDLAAARAVDAATDAARGYRAARARGPRGTSRRPRPLPRAVGGDERRRLRADDRTVPPRAAHPPDARLGRRGRGPPPRDAARAWRRRDDLAHVENARAWLYKLATNVALDAIKARQRRIPSLASFKDVPWLEPYPDPLLEQAPPRRTIPTPRAEGFGDWRLMPLRANRQPAAACYVRRPGSAAYTAFKLDVLRVGAGAGVTTFGVRHLARFGLTTMTTVHEPFTLWREGLPKWLERDRQVGDPAGL